MDLLEIGQMSEDQARLYLESIQWPNGPVCPHCQSQNATRLLGDAARDGTLQCNACREQFTVTVGSVMERSHIPLVKWVMGFHLMVSSKKGISALQLQRNLALGSYRTAWFMAHRIRFAMEGKPMKELLKGSVEVDETYVGGKPRYKGRNKRGRGTSKQAVVVLVERDGNARCHPIERVDAATLKGEIRSQVAQGSIILTDELSSYAGIGKHFDGGHQTVNHSRKQYVRTSKSGFLVHTNTAESFFALIKRGHYGVFHQLSKKHLHRYCAEFSFRWDYRKSTDSERRDAAVGQIGGKRLLYQTASS